MLYYMHEHCTHVLIYMYTSARPAPIMLKNLPIIHLRISQNFHLLFFCA